MVQLVLKYSLLFVAGICIHAGFMHHFSFERVKTHPSIRIWKNPKMAAAISGIIQFSVALIILLFQNYEFGTNIATVIVFGGYCFWAVLASLFASKFQDQAGKP
jgi:hypothetical protein